MHVDARVLVVIETGTPKPLVVELESERPHQMQVRAGVRAEANHIAGVRRNLRLEQDDMHACHYRGIVCARKPERRAAANPERASSSSTAGRFAANRCLRRQRRRFSIGVHASSRARPSRARSATKSRRASGLAAVHVHRRQQRDFVRRRVGDAHRGWIRFGCGLRRIDADGRQQRRADRCACCRRSSMVTAASCVVRECAAGDQGRERRSDQQMCGFSYVLLRALLSSGVEQATCHLPELRCLHRYRCAIRRFRLLVRKSCCVRRTPDRTYASVRAMCTMGERAEVARECANARMRCEEDVTK